MPIQTLRLSTVSFSGRPYVRQRVCCCTRANLQNRVQVLQDAFPNSKQRSIVQSHDLQLEKLLDTVAKMDSKLDNLASDIRTLTTDIKHVDTKLTALDTKLTRELTALDTKMTTEIKHLDTKLTALDAKLDTKLTALDTKLTTETKALEALGLDTKINTTTERLSTKIETEIKILADRSNARLDIRVVILFFVTLLSIDPDSKSILARIISPSHRQSFSTPD